MASIYSRLNLDFDKTKFGGALYLSSAESNTLNTMSTSLTTQQISDIANGNVTTTNYYQNPVSTVCTNLTANTTLIRNFCVNDPANTFPLAVAAAKNLANTANNLLIQVLDFKSHTDNMSGLHTQTSNNDLILDSANIPNYEAAMSQGTDLVTLLYTAENVQNTEAILGCFTSIFINDELVANNSLIKNSYITITNSYNGSNSNLTSTQINSLITDLESVNNYMYIRRTSDWNFFKKQKEILNDYYIVLKVSPKSLGNTQNYLVQNYIGTQTFKNLLANT